MCIRVAVVNSPRVSAIQIRAVKHLYGQGLDGEVKAISLRSLLPLRMW